MLRGLWQLLGSLSTLAFRNSGTHPKLSRGRGAGVLVGLDGREVRLCDPCARVSRVSRVCPGSPRCLFTGTVRTPWFSDDLDRRGAAKGGKFRNEQEARGRPTPGPPISGRGGGYVKFRNEQEAELVASRDRRTDPQLVDGRRIRKFVRKYQIAWGNIA